MLKLEPRPQPSPVMSIASPLLALAITVVIGVALFILLGKDPLRGLQVFFIEPVKNAYALSELAMKATPLLLIALGLALCFRSNVWNIGAEGQFIIGAIAAGGVAMLADKDSSRWIVVAILAAGVAGGMLWAGIVALLRDQANANEILVSLMLVYVADMVLSYLVYGPWKDPAGYNFPQTISFLEPTKIPRLVSGYRVNIGLVIALLAVAGFWLFMFRSYAGFQLQVGGLAPAAARYAGFSSRRHAERRHRPRVCRFGPVDQRARRHRQPRQRRDDAGRRTRRLRDRGAHRQRRSRLRRRRARRRVARRSVRCARDLAQHQPICDRPRVELVRRRLLGLCRHSVHAGKIVRASAFRGPVS